MFFEWDVEMYDAQTNEPAKANTSDLNEELGQVSPYFYLTVTKLQQKLWINDQFTLLRFCSAFAIAVVVWKNHFKLNKNRNHKNEYRTHFCESYTLSLCEHLIAFAGRSEP